MDKYGYLYTEPKVGVHVCLESLLETEAEIVRKLVIRPALH